MGHGFLLVLHSGETLCVRNRPSSSAMVGSNEGLQCPDYKTGFVSSALPVHSKILPRSQKQGCWLFVPNPRGRNYWNGLFDPGSWRGGGSTLRTTVVICRRGEKCHRAALCFLCLVPFGIKTWTHTWVLKTLYLPWCVSEVERWIIYTHAHIFTHLQLDRCVQTGHLNTKTVGHLSFSYKLFATTWISIYSGGHLELSKRPERTFVSLFIPLLRCIMGSGRHQVWVERGGNCFMNSCTWLSIIIAELKLGYIMLLILLYWRKWCYSIFLIFFYVILLHIIFMWFYSFWEMVEPMSINSHIMKQSISLWTGVQWV